MLHLTSSQPKWGALGSVSLSAQRQRLRAWNHKRVDRIYREPELNQHVFILFNEVKEQATEWLWVYNNERPHTAIGGIPPRQYVA
jgi:transposase InsO family protein